MTASREGPRRAALSRDVVAAGGLRVLDREGLSGLTMRSLGAELGVEAMSLYNHVANKDALLDAVAEQVVAEIRRPDPDAPWRDALRDLYRNLRTAVLAHPHAAPLIATRPLASQAALVPVDATLAALLRGGLSPAAAVSTFWLLTNYAIGALMSEVAYTAERRSVSIGPSGLSRDLGDELAVLAALAPLIEGADYAVEYERGLEVLLAAIVAGSD